MGQAQWLRRHEGTLRAGIASELGLPASVRVATGTGDTTAAAIGAGAVQDYRGHLYDVPKLVPVAASYRPDRASRSRSDQQYRAFRELYRGYSRTRRRYGS